MLSSLRSARLDKTPIWLLLTNLYWPEISIYYGRSQRLSIPLLEHGFKVFPLAPCQQLILTTEEPGKRTVLEVLKVDNFLQNEIATVTGALIAKCPSSILCKTLWCQRNRARPGVSMTCGSENLHQRYDEQTATRPTRMTSEGLPLPQIIQVLDSISLGSNVRSVSRSCLSICTDVSLLTSVVMQWATTHFRSGYSRLYFAARLVRRWRRSGTCSQRIVLSALHSCSDTSRFDVAKVSRFVTELVRSKDFSIPKLLQWVMARGILSSQQSPNKVCCASNWNFMC